MAGVLGNMIGVCVGPRKTARRGREGRRKELELTGCTSSTASSRSQR